MGYDNITVHNCYIIILHKCDELITDPNSTTQQQQSTPLSNQAIDSLSVSNKKIFQKSPATESQQQTSSGNTEHQHRNSSGILLNPVAFFFAGLILLNNPNFWG